MKATREINKLKKELKKYGWTRSDFSSVKYCVAGDVKLWKRTLQLHLNQKIK